MTIEDAKIQVPIKDLINCEEIIERQRRELGDYREKLTDAKMEIRYLKAQVEKLERLQESDEGVS